MRPEIKPVKRAKKPRYPGHADPNPLEEGYDVPYPASGKLLAAVAGLGLAGGGPALAQDGGKPKNPFAIAKSGLPFQTSPFGTGQPARLTADAARKVIAKVFEDAGYDLRKDHTIEDDGVSFQAHGYDPRRRVGFVFGDWHSLDDDAVVRWGRRGKPPLAPELLVRGRMSGLPADDRALAAKALKMAPGKERDAILKAILRRDHDRRLSLAEAEQIEKDTVRKKRFIAVISGFDSRFEYQFGLTPEVLERVQKAKDNAERTKIYREAADAMAKKALAKLEKSVREYIAWARTQGLR